MKQQLIRRASLKRAALSAGLLLALSACGGSDGDVVAPAETPPATPAAPALADLIAARVHYFGAENVNTQTGEVRKDLLIMSWATNTTYAAAINGKVVLLDASLLRREEAPGRTPTTLSEMARLMPSHIFIGKAAPGHVDLAANIAFRTGATIVGVQEHCDAVEADARRQQSWNGRAQLLKCTVVAPKDQPLGEKVNVVEIADLGLCVRAVKHSDRLVATVDPTLPPLGFNWGEGSDVRDATYWPLGLAAQDGVGSSAGTSGPSVVYHLTLSGGRNFGLAWNDRVGSLKDSSPTVTALLRALPKTDLQVGSVDATNAGTTGLRDPALYIQALQPKIFFPAGHDAASQRAGAFNTAEFMKRALESALTALAVPSGTAGTQVRVNFDPSDYIKPHYMTFDPAAPAWQRTGDRASSATCK